MSNIVMVLGKSGTGKSSSIKNLDPKETVVVNLLGKRLPFKGSTQVYNKENKNLFQLDKYDSIVSLLKSIDSSAPHVRNVVLDDFTYLMRKEYFGRATEGGYNRFTEIAMHFQLVVSTCETLRQDLNVFIVMHSEEVYSDKVLTGFKASTIGNMVDNQYNPLEVVPMVLYCAVRYDGKGNPEYGFYTHRLMQGTTEIPAKTPEGMFKEDFIPNDLSLVVKAMDEYYN